MMQPTDIRSHNFGKGLFGYKKTDVDQYVDTVYRAYDELFTENKKLRDEKEALVKELNVLKYEMEKQSSDDSKADEPKKEEKVEEKKADVTIDDPFDDVFTDTSSEGKIKMSTKKDDEAESATSKFFQNDNADDVFGDGDDVFVGEIEEARKPNKVMIGDGEEESDDFEFL